MAMNHRLLRPRASGGGFDPRSIAGCICNLDASALSSLYQSSDGTTPATATDDPIGYWGDLSGFGNHAKQTVAAGSRPFLKLNNQNGLPGLLFDGSNDWMTATIAGFQSLSAVTILQVIKPTASAVADTNSAQFWGFGNLGNASSPYPASRGIASGSSTGVLSGELINIGAESSSHTAGRLGSSSYSRSASTAQLISTTLGVAVTTLSVNNNAQSLNLSYQISTATDIGPSSIGYTLDNDLHIAALRANGTIIVSLETTLHQMIVYNRQLTAAELTAIWNAISVKWGIT